MSIHSVAAPSDAVLSRMLDEELAPIPDEYADFIAVGSESSDDEDYYELPLWIAMLGVFVLALSIAAFAFFLSYKHESICGKHAAKKAENKEDDEIVSQLEKGETPRVSTKKFNDPNVPDTGFNGSFHTHETLGAASYETEESSVGSGSDSSSQQHQSINGNSVRSASTTNSRKSLEELVTEPRCVLCSVPYEEGEDITRSENPKCHHEYHTECLLKHWTKTKSEENDRKCPVCKERYCLEVSC